MLCLCRKKFSQPFLDASQENASATEVPETYAENLDAEFDQQYQFQDEMVNMNTFQTEVEEPEEQEEDDYSQNEAEDELENEKFEFDYSLKNDRPQFQKTED